MVSRPDWPAFRKAYIMMAEDFREAWRAYDFFWKVAKEAHELEIKNKALALQKEVDRLIGRRRSYKNAA